MANKIEFKNFATGDIKTWSTDPDHLSGNSTEMTFDIYVVNSSLSLDAKMGTMHIWNHITEEFRGSQEPAYVEKIEIRAYFEKTSTSAYFNSVWFYIPWDQDIYGMYGSTKKKPTDLYYINNTYLKNFASSKDNPAVIAKIESSEVTAKEEDKKLDLSSVVTIRSGYSSDSWSSGTIASISSVRITFKKYQFKCEFDPGKGSWAGSYHDQSITWGQSPKDPGSLNSPADSPKKTISIIVDNGSNATPTADNLKGELDGTWSYSWSPSLNTKIYSNTDFTAKWESTQTPNTLTLPSVAPIRTGYTFGGWYTEANGKGKLVGDTPGGNSLITFSADDNGKTIYANWGEISQDYSVYYKAKNGNTEVDLRDSKGNTYQELKVDYTQEVVPTLPDINGYDKPSKLIILQYPGDSSKIGQEVSSIKGSYPLGSVFGAYYTPITYSVSLDLRGGLINGSNKVDPITYNILSEKINLREYTPVINNTTFVGWVGSDNKYKDEIDPSKKEWQVRSQTLWADYIPLGKFVYTDKGWTPIINTWIYNGTKWIGDSKDQTKLVNTTPVAYVKTESGWKIEYGGQNRPTN